MKRFHMDLTVGALDRTIAFCSALFDAVPTVHHDDYAKWMLEDSTVNFAISTRGTQPGVAGTGVCCSSEAAPHGTACC